MGILTTYWNYVECKVDWDVDMYTKAPSGIKKVRTVGKGCKGVLFRSVFSEQADFSQFLNGLTLDQVRRSRSGGGQDLLFCPKPEEQRSIGVLRIVRPKGFSKIKEYQPFTVVAGTGGKPIAITGPVERDAVAQQFDVLLESTEFILESAQEQMAERFQLQETFGNFNVFFYGKRAEIFTYSGSLLNGNGSLQWRNQFIENYEKHLRGTRCVEERARVYLLYDDVIREGFILSAGTSQESSVDGVVKFTFTMLITGKRTLGEVPPNRTDVISVKKSAPNNEFGISEFLYKRATNDDGLPGVLRGYDESSGGLEINTGVFQFSEISTFESKEPPEDLKRAMDNRSIKALQAKQADGQIQESGTLDTDVIQDFIDAGELSANAASIISGKGPLDPENLTGGQIIQELLRTGSGITVESLTFKKAIQVAESFATENAARAGSHAATLGEIVAFFRNADRRVTVEAANQNFLSKFTVENGKYVFVESLADTLLSVLVAEGRKILDFRSKQLSAANQEVAGYSTVALAELMASGVKEVRTANVVAFYAAVLCLVSRPSGGLYPSIQSSFSDVASLGGKENALDYVRSQTVKKLQSALAGADTLVKEDVFGAIQAFVNSSVGGLLSSLNPGGDIESSPVSEEMFRQAALYGTSKAAMSAMSYLSAACTYLTSIAQEMLGSFQRVTADNIAANTLGSGPDVTKGYVTKAYAESLDLASKEASSETDLAILDGVGEFTKYGGNDYMVLPAGFIHGTEVVVGKYDSLTVSFAGGGPVISIKRPAGLDAGMLYSLGYIPLKPGQRGQIAALGSQATTYFELGHRKVRLNCPRLNRRDVQSYMTLEYQLRGLANAGSPGAKINFGGTERSSVLHMTAVATELRNATLPISRNYVGSGVAPYKRSSLSEIRDSVKALLQTISADAIASIVSGTAAAVAAIIQDPSKLKSNSTLNERILSELSISRFTSGPAAIPSVAVANSGLVSFGARVSNYLEFVRMTEVEAPAADRLSKLKAAIEAALVNAAAGDDRAADVARSDGEVRKSVCVKSSTVI